MFVRGNSEPPGAPTIPGNVRHAGVVGQPGPSGLTDVLHGRNDDASRCRRARHGRARSSGLAAAHQEQLHACLPHDERVVAAAAQALTLTLTLTLTQAAPWTLTRPTRDRGRFSAAPYDPLPSCRRRRRDRHMD